MSSFYPTLASMINSMIKREGDIVDYIGESRLDPSLSIINRGCVLPVWYTSLVFWK